MQQPKLFMAILGATPKGRLTEQHDVFFGIGNTLSDLVPQIKAFWPEADKIHLDAWRMVLAVDGYDIAIAADEADNKLKLFFINLGGYKPGDPEEYHYKLLVVAETMAEAVKAAKQTAFYKHTGFNGAVSHIDNKFGIDVDDAHLVSEVLRTERQNVRILIRKSDNTPEDPWHIGYLPVEKLINGVSV